MKRDQRAMQDAIAKVAARIDAERAPYFARGVRFMHMTMQAYKWLVAFYRCSYRR
jgi:hypothetical protein